MRSLWLKTKDWVKWIVALPFGLLVEPGGYGLSLGRCAMTTLHGVLIWMLYHQPALMVSMMRWEFVFLILVIYVILSAYNYGKKPWVKEVLLTLTTNVLGRAAGASSGPIVREGLKVASNLGMPLPGAPDAPNDDPAVEPDAEGFGPRPGGNTA
jgi:hypothetical protein